ncbi:bark storage protein A-like [Chenopodium quinoa]|uniref:Nucleoside phosphorylase domain-containing protein n=1 Tax=Chenopodium quinoa TaxID=63459 RepID=A0A803L2N4_CHEQI|nr:bark storage protein A-like [Chenopodium quinoa]
MASEMWGVKLAVLVLGLLVLVPESTQLNVDHPLFSVVQKINIESGPFLGLVISSGRDEKFLKNSTYFTPHKSIPSLTISGRKFNIGKFNDVPAIYVLAGEPLANVGVTVQILIDTFRISGIINYGSSATVSNKVFITDVLVPSQVAYTGSWTWEKHNSVLVAPSLDFGRYNLPEAGDNALGSVHYQSVPIYTSTSSKQKKALFINVHSDWVKLASEINYGERPTVHIGPDVKIGSADVYLLNEAYAKALNQILGVSAVETESAAVVTTAIANGVPHIVFRGASNRPGSPSETRLSEVTAKNVLKTVAKFVDAAYPVAIKNYAMPY